MPIQIDMVYASRQLRRVKRRNSLCTKAVSGREFNQVISLSRRAVCLEGQSVNVLAPFLDGRLVTTPIVTPRNTNMYM